METERDGFRFQRLMALFKVAYTELQYWLVGMTPEGYHFEQARNFDRLGNARRAAHHSHEVLKYSEYPEPRARLGYYYATLGRHAEAVDHYRKAIQTWSHPSLLLALAQAELRIGEYRAAGEMLERAERSEMKDELAQAIADVRLELAAAKSAL